MRRRTPDWAALKTKGMREGVTVRRLSDGTWVATSASDPRAACRVTTGRCECRGHAFTGRCKHRALLLAATAEELFRGAHQDGRGRPDAAKLAAGVSQG